MTNPKTVLVTGAKGFIGSALVAEMEKKGWTVILAVKKPNSINEVYMDLTDISSIKALVSKQPLDAIVHLAAMVKFDEVSIEELHIPNVKATSELLEVAKDCDALFIFSSSALIANSRATSITPRTPDSPDFAYLHSKLLAEELIKASKVKSTILRIGGVYGLNGPSHLSLNRAISCVKNGEKPIQIGSGEAKRNYIYVKDLAKIIVRAIESNIDGTHLIAGHEDNSISDMLQMLCDKFIPGEKPVILDGPVASNQLIEPSLLLLGNYTFMAAVEDMYKEALS
jgi:nucleoside-diphosphate-sugar epimerase